jgi:hypothetical protein
MAHLVDELDKWTKVHRIADAPQAPAMPRQRKSSEEVKERVERRMAEIDSLTPEQRLVVHEYGWNLVKTFFQHGVTSPRSMRGLINAVIEMAIDRKDRPSADTEESL